MIGDDMGRNLQNGASVWQGTNQTVAQKEASMRITITLLAFTLLAAGCNSITGASDITYEVTGVGRASITYAIGGSTNQLDAALPWSLSFSADRDEFLYVSAQKDGSSACVFARILKKGDLLESGTGCGAFAIATASATN